MPLDIAETIRGVRKIFEEKYPNPVRVVSVGVPLEAILEDVNNEKWEKISIEFCGGTHVAKTGDIKQLVILSEESIAKGIRRIIAITGWMAEDACRKANDFEAKLRKVERMPFSLEKLTYATTLKAENENNKGTIPSVRRSQFKERIKAIEMEAAKIAKERAKADEKAIISAIIQHFEGEDGEKKPGMVAALPVTPDPKLLGNSILTAMKKWKRKKSVYLLAADAAKVVHTCYVPPVYPAFGSSLLTLGIGGSSEIESEGMV